VGRILNDTDWSKQTLDASKNKLMDLGWIVCYGRGRFSDLYYPQLGKSDPEHKWKDKDARDAAVDKRKAKKRLLFLDEELPVFENPFPVYQELISKFINK
jgi:hypothetical protein